jgi:ribonuclease VapC
MLCGEPGANIVAAAIDNPAMLTVNLAEVIGFYARRASSEEMNRELLGSLPIQLHPLDEELAYSVGLLLPLLASAGLSFDDRAAWRWRDGLAPRR